MSDAEQRERVAKPTLEYPCGTPPDAGRTIEVLPGIHWIRMPLPGPLNHINLWSVKDEGGYALVDTGMRTEEATAAWRDLFALGPPCTPLTRVLITHMHPDHAGMAGWLTRKFSCRMWMTRQEYLYCRILMSDTGREAPEEALSLYRRAGWSADALEAYRARFGNFGKRIHPLPESFRRMQDGEEFVINGRLWRVIVGTGHSPEHACLYCPEQKVLISGDQVLPRISSNISVHPTEPDADPMREWLESLDKLREQIPDDVLVLPAHNEPFKGLHARLEYLKQSQLRTLARLLGRLVEPRRVVDTFVALFGREINQSDSMLLNLATGEAQACLNYLCFCGEVSRATDASGVDWYSAANT